MTEYLGILAFLEGLALVLSPCILPILPLVLSGSLSDGKRRPFGIILGFIITFSIVTLFSRFLVQAAHINPDLLRNASYILLILFGMMMLSTFLTERFALATNRLSQVGTSLDTNGGFLSGIVLGALIGIIWTPCAGPILAAVIVQVATSQTTVSSIITVVAFSIGASVPMLLIAVLGQTIIHKFNFIKRHTVFVRKSLGVILIAVVLMLMFNEGMLFSNFNHPTSEESATQLENGLTLPYAAPVIDGIVQWINSPPLSINELKGKVVLIDFWTYSCINCIRTLPYLKDWYAKYHEKGLVIIGIHAPEFEFEKNSNNVENAVKKFGILYPVAMDNQYATWQNYNNRYWPAHYLIDKNGQVVYKHFGEGGYDETENNIRYLLGVKYGKLSPQPSENAVYAQTPETYLGFERAQGFADGTTINNQSYLYHYPTVLPDDAWALEGLWTVYADKIVANAASSSIKLHFNARNVYAVMGAPQGAVRIHLQLNGKPVIADKGNDVQNSQVIVQSNQLYSLIQLKKFGAGELEITAEAPGLEIYTFTFGS